jgi:hypothetical protein
LAGVIETAAAPVVVNTSGAFDSIGRGDPAGLLGNYGFDLLSPPSPASPGISNDAWSVLGSGGGAHSGGFGLSDQNYGLLDGSRGAWSVAVAVGWSNSTGHGPGPSS